MRAQIADTPELRAAANALIGRQYAAAGFGQHQLPSGAGSESIVVLDHEVVVGTLSITFDSPDGLLVDDTYARFVTDRRDMNRRCAEITKLAFAVPTRAPAGIEAAFRLAVHILLRRRSTDLFVEVHPNQVKIYRRRFGFWPVGDETTTERVAAPSRLLWIELEMLRRTIDRRERNRAIV